jgi:hypothetical protein
VKLREVVGGGKVDGSRIKATHWPCNISHTKQRRRRRRRKEEEKKKQQQHKRG